MRTGALGLCVDGNFFLADLAKAWVLTEIGPKRDPDTLKVFLSNMERLLHAKAHGYRSSVPVASGLKTKCALG